MGAIRNVMVPLLSASLCSLLQSSLLCEFEDGSSVLTLPILITVYIIKRFKKQYLVFSGGLCASFPQLCSIYFVFKNSALLCRPTDYGLDPKLPSVLLVSSQPYALPRVFVEKICACLQSCTEEGSYFPPAMEAMRALSSHGPVTAD